jgi:phage terminase large subunit GpA-like protein
MKYTCPTEHVNDAGDVLIGCGGEFHTTPDEEGYVDCPHCGLWFTPRMEAIRADAEALSIPLDPIAGKSKPEHALAVLILTPHIRAYLEKHDPRALEQARTALGLAPVA